MKKIFGIFLGVLSGLLCAVSQAAEKFEILPDLPEPLAAAQASSVSTTDTSNTIAAQTIGQEPSLISVVFSLLVVILLIYVTGIIYAKLNKLGFKTLKKQMGDVDASKVSVVSTTPLGNNKTLHVVELDGKRMLIGASSNAIQLIKDLGSFPPADTDKLEYSNIEIPNIRIPKIEIPKIEFPNIGFTKANPRFKNNDNTKEDITNSEENDDFQISDIYEEGSDGIIDKLFHTTSSAATEDTLETTTESHKVDPDEYVLYKKYL